MADRDARDRNHPDYDPVAALTECHDCWASGAWDDRNAIHDLEEVMLHLERLLAQRHVSPSADALIDAVRRGENRAHAYSSQRVTALRGGASPAEVEQWQQTYPHRDEREFMRAEVIALLSSQPTAEEAVRDARCEHGMSLADLCQYAEQVANGEYLPEHVREQVRRETLHAALEAVLALHKPNGGAVGGDTNVRGCGTCGDGYDVEWPCPTVRAISEHITIESEGS